MRKLLILVAMAALPVFAETPPAPKQAVKAEIRIVQDGLDPVLLSAKRPEMAARANLLTGEGFWRFIFPADQPEVPGSPLTFITTVDPNDLPGGGFFLCNMKKSGKKFYFNVSTDAAGAPKGEFVEAEPSDMQSAKNPDGSFTYKVTQSLKPGVYALYFSDNQYAWPFVVK